MKILFVIDDVFEYVSATLFHGLKMLGHEVYDTTYKWFMYDDPDYSENDYKNLYGCGFTIKKSLPYSLSNKNIDRSKDVITDMIYNKYFDICIFSVYNHYKEYLEDVIKAGYDKSQIILIDGNDSINIDPYYVNGLYFKRELYFSHIMQIRNKYLFIYPISYSIPSTKFWSTPNIDIKNTYIIDNTLNALNKPKTYNSEEEYYNSYRKSYFANAVIKDGVNTMKLFEIISQYCLPYFENFNTIPRSFLTWFPNDLQLEANELYWKIYMYGMSTGDTLFKLYTNILNKYFDYAKKYLSSTFIANYVIDKSLKF